LSSKPTLFREDSLVVAGGYFGGLKTASVVKLEVLALECCY